MLTSKRLATVQRLQAAATGGPSIKRGDTGEAVRVLQQAFISLNFSMPVSTRNWTSLPDGAFGDETFRAVKSFQARYGLQPDGIVGKDTLGKLNELFSTSAKSAPQGCGNCYHRHRPYTPPHLIQAAFSAESSEDSAQLPTSIRFLNRQEITQAETVFANSLDFGKILVSNGLGVNGRAFVTIVPTQDGMPNMTLVNWGRSPSPSTFFHELTHVWQSQHHLERAAFMANALISQAAGDLFGGSAYAFIPGRTFARYGAEQIAQQVQRGKTDIISHIRSFVLGVPDPLNLPVPGLPFWETEGAPGVET